MRDNTASYAHMCTAAHLTREGKNNPVFSQGHDAPCAPCRTVIAGGCWCATEQPLAWCAAAAGRRLRCRQHLGTEPRGQYAAWRQPVTAGQPGAAGTRSPARQGSVLSAYPGRVRGWGGMGWGNMGWWKWEGCCQLRMMVVRYEYVVGTGRGVSAHWRTAMCKCTLANGDRNPLPCN